MEIIYVSRKADVKSLKMALVTCCWLKITSCLAEKSRVEYVYMHTVYICIYMFVHIDIHAHTYIHTYVYAYEYS